ncbi:MAG: ABC transporter substrate-binding protein [Armatimonadetes bacterium]|nr:ABC transporter substrate-binding protein [Armatimonadota bacterium]
MTLPWTRLSALDAGRRVVQTLAAVLVVAVVQGCVSRSSSPGVRTSSETNAAPKRIVSLSPSTTEVLYALGLGSRVVGVTKQCNFPPEARSRPKVGDVNISVEAVLALKPDLVVGHALLNRQPLEALRKAGIRTAEMNPVSWREVGDEIESLGKVCGAPDRGAVIRAQMDTAYTEVQRRYAGKKARPLVLFAVQGNPVWAAGPKTFVDDMITVAGGVNVAHDASPGFNHLSQELTAKYQPDFIFVTDTAARKDILNSPLWKRAPAVRRGKVFQVDPDLYLRPAPRLVDGLRQMAREIGPAHSAGSSLQP